MDCSAARKTQKADREKLRRDRLNEQFVELGNVLGKSVSPFHIGNLIDTSISVVLVRELTKRSSGYNWKLLNNMGVKKNEWNSITKAVFPLSDGYKLPEHAWYYCIPSSFL